VLKDYNRLVLEDVPKPAPGPTQVVVRVRATGICATDHKAVRGKRRNVTFPAVLGHENAGVVDGIGSAVQHFREGDEVILSPRGYCGLCETCRMGLFHYCASGFSTGGDGSRQIMQGGFAEYMVTDQTNCFHKPAGLSFRAAALTEPLSGAWKGLIQYSRLTIGEDVVIIGTGGIGLLCVMVARRAGAGSVIAVDTSEYALANARRLGATHAVNPRTCRVRDEVYRIVPRGPDLIVEAAGPLDAVDLMFDLRRRGTRVNLFGITTHEKFALDGGDTHFLETRMDASFSTTPLAMTMAIRLQERGLVNTEEIISHVFPLERIEEAMAVMDTAERNKVMVAQD
jgi:threonine dehydrogenase-like Zn-dependent dehydrogenase